ncbi:MAG: hypothetical protein IJ874_04705 [Ruminococcus sp.]|nr:hypothetical protein [Ruminococcus sp.]
MNRLKRVMAAVSAIAMLCGGSGLQTTAAEITSDVITANEKQASELKTRDVWCANEDVNRWESEHFQFIWGKNGADSSKITTSFLEENAKNLEACWNVYMNDLHMEPPTQSVEEYLRDGNEYKVNFYISGTGLSPFEDDWAYMGYDNQGYAFMFCCVGAMQNSPNPSWVLPHEFGHVVTAHQRGWNSNKYASALWEAIANWYREQFLYSDYYQQWAGVTGVTDFFETYMKNLCFTPIIGRDNYAAWFFLQYLTENPDNLGNLGSSFVKDLMQQGQVDEYLYKEIARLSDTDMKELLGNYAKRVATFDLAHKSDYAARMEQLTSSGAWNWGEMYTVLEKTTSKDNYYTVPTERAPQQFGINLIPLEITGDTISVTLEGLSDTDGADWRACIAVEPYSGQTRYSDLFKPGETGTISAGTDVRSAYLVVTATPDESAWQEIGVPWAYGTGEFDENNYPFLSKNRYPYAVTIDGASVLQTQISGATLRGHYHSNGGGFVADTATVADSVYVGPNAKVLEYANVSGNAVIDGYAIVTGSAKVSGNAVVNGHAVVAENAQVKDNAIISDYAGVMGQSVISDNARVIESGLVFNTYKVSDNATVKGVAYCLAGGSASGQAMPDGDYYDDSGRGVRAGSVYGWASPDSYVNSRTYTDGQVAGLEFGTDSSVVAKDTYTSTYGLVHGGASWAAEKTSGKGVLTLTGGALTGDSSYAALHDADYQTAVLLRDDEYQSLFTFADNEGKKGLTVFAQDGSICLRAFVDRNGTTEEVTVNNAYKPGEWVTVSTIITGDTAKLVVNNGREVLTESGAFTIDPVDIMSNDTRYSIGEGMNGSMDFFRVYYKEVAEPEYYYTETEDISAEAKQGTIKLSVVDAQTGEYVNVPGVSLQGIPCRYVDDPDKELPGNIAVTSVSVDGNPFETKVLAQTGTGEFWLSWSAVILRGLPEGYESYESDSVVFDETDSAEITLRLYKAQETTAAATTTTAPPETTTTATAAETQTTAAVETHWGDANEDGKVNMADAVAVLQNLANSAKYPLSAQGAVNADCDGGAGLTGTDAITILRVEAGEIKQSELPLGS